MTILKSLANFAKYTNDDVALLRAPVYALEEGLKGALSWLDHRNFYFLISTLCLLPNATKYTKKLVKIDPTKQDGTRILRKKYRKVDCD